MNRIIIAGNGFDLAHDLKTKYEDFIFWCFEQYGYKLLHSSDLVVSDGLCSFKIKDGVNVPNWASVFKGWYYKEKIQLFHGMKEMFSLMLFRIRTYVIFHSRAYFSRESGIGYC